MKFIILFSFLFYFGCKIGQGPPPPIARVNLSASLSSMIVGDSLRLDVNVANIENLFAISFEIEFDPSYLEVNMNSGEMNYSTFTNQNFGPVVLLDTLGVISVALGGDTINGAIFSFFIHGLQSGTTIMELDEVNLLQKDGMHVSGIDGLILSGVTITVIDAVSE